MHALYKGFANFEQGAYSGTVTVFKYYLKKLKETFASMEAPK